MNGSASIGPTKGLGLHGPSGSAGQTPLLGTR